MKKLLVSFAMFMLLYSCQKEVLTGPSSTITVQGDESVTHYSDYTEAGFDRNNHPFFKALDYHKYQFEMRAGATGNPGSNPTGVTLQTNFQKAPNGHVGNIIIGQKTFVPGTSNDYGYVIGEPITDPTLLSNFGTATYFKFSGNGAVTSFAGNLRLPKIMNITSVPSFTESQTISRNQNYVVRFQDDSQLGLPVLLQIAWTYGPHQPLQGQYKSVTNLFLVNDNGSVVLKSEMFLDIPSGAQDVFVTLWRGNAAVNNQDLFYIAATAKSFSVTLTD